MNRFKKILMDDGGKLRLGWRIAAGLAVYALAFYGIIWVASAGFGALFAAWNLKSENLIYAPQWAQAIVLWHTDFTYVLAYAASICAALIFAGRKKVKSGCAAGKFGVAALLGIGSGALLTAASFVFDSMRLEAPLTEPSVSAYAFSALIVLVLGSISGEVLTKLLVFDPVRKRFGRLWSYAAVCAMAVLLAGTWNRPLGLINALLMGIVGCAIYERGGLLVSSALSAAWTAWTTWLFAWPNSSAASVYRMYTVSDIWLTGGNAGAANGFGCTMIWMIIAWVLFREELKKWISCMKLRRNTNGKDSHCDRRSGLERRKLLRSGAAGNAGQGGSRRAR